MNVVENRQEFAIFFGAVGLYLDQEIEKANAGIDKAGDGSKLIQRGRIKPPAPARAWFGNTLLELKFGAMRTCTLSLSGTLDRKLQPCASLIEAKLQSERRDQPNPAEENISFLLEKRLSGTKAYRVGPDGRPQPQMEFGAPEIAQTIVTGIVRGHFD
jgi:hypothetical protein